MSNDDQSLRKYFGNPEVKSALEGYVNSHYMRPDKLVRIAVNAILRSEKLQLCTRQSLLNCIMSTAAVSLEPNTILQHAAIIPYKNRRLVAGQWIDVWEAEYQIMYRGYIVLAKRDPTVRDIRAGVAYERDEFEASIGDGGRFFHRVDYKAIAQSTDAEPRGKPIAAFCYLRQDDMQSQTVLPWYEILKIRDRSETYRALVARDKEASEAYAQDPKEKLRKDAVKAAEKLASTPWVLWADEMAAKTAIKRHIKSLALQELSTAVAIEERIERHGTASINEGFIEGVKAGEVPEDPPELEDKSQDGTTLEGFGEAREGELVGAARVMTRGQLTEVQRELKRATLSEDQIREHFGATDTAAIDYQAALEWIRNSQAHT